MYDSYQKVGKDYLEHYGVKGMKWGKHKKKQEEQASERVLSDIIAFRNRSVSSSRSMPYGTIHINSNGNVEVNYLDKDGVLVKTGNLNDGGIPKEAVNQAYSKISTMQLAQKKFQNRGKKAIDQVTKTHSKEKVGSLSSMRVRTGKEKLKSILNKLKNAIPKKPINIKS